MRRRKRRKQRKIIILTSIALLFVLTTGYAAFQTNLNITAKGNIKEIGITIKELRDNYCKQTTGDGLYKDTYEEGRCVYSGTDPNNYITFNNELWRIVAVESDNTLKIMKNVSVGDNMAWDTTNSNQWSRPATLNTYLNNDYYNNLNEEAKQLIQPHAWQVGAVEYGNSDLSNQILSEKSETWDGNIGLINVSDFLKANSNVNACGNYKLNGTNYKTCKTTNYIVPAQGYLWTISKATDSAVYVFDIHGSNNTTGGDIRGGTPKDTIYSVHPVTHLKPTIHLLGEGTKENPYQIVNK